MKVAAIIAEYNPFHNGHEFQIKKVRELLGDDTAIIAIMSGNFTQRAEPAIFEKFTRAKVAVDSGVNLVLELPFPFSSQSAEYFARAGVHIAEALGLVDYLAFGSECGDIELLKRVAEFTSGDEYKKAIVDFSDNKVMRGSGYPKAAESFVKSRFGNDADGIFSPNNILSIEYIKALINESSNIIPLTVKREGAGYSDGFTPDTYMQSASAIREIITRNPDSALDYIPFSTKESVLDSLKSGKRSNFSKLDAAIISHLRLNPPDSKSNIHEATGGLYNRLCDHAARTDTISTLVDSAYTKKYTKARIRRAILNSFFGVTSSDVCSMPEYTQLLAADTVGTALLKKAKKTTKVRIITKPADYEGLSCIGTRQKELSDRADSVYQLTLSVPNPGDFSITRSPYVKKQ